MRCVRFIKMQKNMYFDYFGGDCFAAVTEGDTLVEFHLDSAGASDISGNIYKGRVVNVLEGMQAAFVAFGQAKNGYLYAGDIPAAEGVGEVTQKLSVGVGDEVMVQVSALSPYRIWVVTPASERSDTVMVWGWPSATPS